MTDRKRLFIPALALFLAATGARAESSMDVLTPLIERTACAASGINGNPAAVFILQEKKEGKTRAFAGYLARRICGLMSLKNPDIALVCPDIDEIPAALIESFTTETPDALAPERLTEMVPAQSCIILRCRKKWKTVEIEIKVYDDSEKKFIFEENASFMPGRGMKVLFDNRAQESEIENKIMNDICADMRNEITRVLRSGENNTAAALALAESIDPFSSFGRIHSPLIDYLIRMKTADEGYRRFIIGSLMASRTAARDERKAFLVMDMVRYLSSDGAVDGDEWEAGLAALTGLDPGEAPKACLRELVFTSAGSPPADSLITERIDRYFFEMQGALRPGMEFDAIFDDMVQTIASLPDGRGKNIGLLRCFDKYCGTVSPGPGSGCYPALKRAYLTEEDPGRRVLFLKHLCRYFSQVNGAGPGELLDFISLFNQDTAAPVTGVTAVLSDFDVFIGECGNFLPEYFKSLSDKDERKKAALFCMNRGISCPDIVPSAGEIIALLSSRDKFDAEDGIDYAMAFPGNDQAIETAVILLMQSMDRETGPASTAVLEKAIRYCAVKRCTGPETISMMVSLLASRHEGICHLAAGALEQIGQEAVPLLMTNISGKEDFSALLSITILKKIAPSSESVSSLLQKKASLTANRWIAAEALASPEKNE